MGTFRCFLNTYLFYEINDTFKLIRYNTNHYDKLFVN